MGEDMASVPDEEMLLEPFSIIENTIDMQAVITRLRDFLNVDHVAYLSAKTDASPAGHSPRPSRGRSGTVHGTSDPAPVPANDASSGGIAAASLRYMRLTYTASWLTYPASWMERYVQMGYIDVDPVVREAFVRTLPFDWSELKTQNAAEVLFFTDALAHGIGPRGLCIPLRSKDGYRALFSVSSATSEEGWATFRKIIQPMLIQIANRVHQRVVKELFGEDRPHLTARELECLRWIALGKDTSEIAIILNISPYTVREYLKSARYKLDCVSSAQAVSKAAKLGLLIL
jgi:LuxR family transcriptional regulator, quorum-sensing system regulator CinR